MPEKVILGLSGGVDSGTSIKKLKEMGFKKIFAFNHLVYNGIKAGSPEVLGRAAEISRREGIFFEIINMTEDFSRIIVDDFCSMYLRGETPNPCVICNEKIKFTLFYDKAVEILVEKKLAEKDEKIFYSTGHYARLEKKEGNLFLKKAIDPDKDQSYMLYRLPRTILDRCVFPMGDYFKKDILKEAEKNSFLFENVKESQDICFVDGDYSDFIYSCSGNAVNPGPGKIIDTQGNYLGTHRGFINYTIGQRKGLGLGNGPWYVVKVCEKSNTVTAGREEEQGQTEFEAYKLNWFIDTEKFINTSSSLNCMVKVRYNSQEKDCAVSFTAADCVMVTLSEKTVITPGQSAVFYDKDLVIGGGIICRSLT